MANTTSLTDNDRKILIMAWHSFKTNPAVDYTKLMQMGSYKTPASATACYLAARKKLLSSDGTKMTDNDRKLIVMAWQCFKSPPEVDYKKLKEKGGYKTTASATACYLAVKKKLLGMAPRDARTPLSSPAKASGNKRKVGKKAATEYEASTEDETPSKHIKISPGVKEEKRGGDVGGEELQCEEGSLAPVPAARDNEGGSGAVSEAEEGKEDEGEVEKEGEEDEDGKEEDDQEEEREDTEQDLVGAKLLTTAQDYLEAGDDV